MPASTLDPVKTAIRNVLVKNNNSEYLNSQLASSAHRVLCTKIDFEPAESYQNDVLNDLKSKYIVLQPNNKPQINGRKYESSSQPNAEESLSKPQTVLYPIDNVQLGWSDSDWGVGAGMMNMGNTCYLNSTLQALFHVPALVNWLLSDKQHLLQCENNSGGAQSCCIICAVSKTLQASQVKNGNAIRPWLVYSKLRLVCRHLIPGRQEDAHEFLRYLVEAMEKAYILRFRHLGNLDSRSKETTPLNQILGGYLRSTVRCLECGHVSTTFQHFQDLLLDIRKGNTLDEALDLYFSKEKLDDMAYHCDHCKKKVIATKQFTLERAPMVLCIQLKRFSVSNNKITKQITYKPKMDLTRFARHKTSTPLLYQLVAIVTHMGPTVSCGHYTAVARAASGDYYVFDDSTVRQVSQQTVLNTNAYIMLYEAIRPTSNQNATVSKSLKPEHTSDTKNNSISQTSNGILTPKNNTDCKKNDIQKNSSNGNSIISNGKNSDTSDSDLSDNSDKEIASNNNNKNIIPLPYITSQNFSSNTSLNNGKNSPNIINKKEENSSQNLVKNGNKSSENENFVKKWENKYIFNDKKSDTPKTSPLKSDNFSNSDSSSKKWDKNNLDRKSSLDVTKNNLSYKNVSPSSSASENNKNFSNNILSSNSDNINLNKNENDNFVRKWENKYVNQNQMENGRKYNSNGNENGESSNSYRRENSSDNSNSSRVTKLVPYDVNDSSSSSSSEDSNQNTSPETKIQTKASTVSNWKVSPVLDTPINPSLQGNSGWKSRTETINELVKMSNEGYAAPVSSWNGTRPHIEKQIANERREERKRCMMDNEDRGKAKHPRLNNSQNNYQHSNSNYNPFQAYSNNNRNRWNNEPNNKNFYSQKHRYNGQRKTGNHHYNNRYRDKFRH